MDSNLPVPNNHCNVLYRQTYNTYGSIDADGLTQDNRVGNVQKTGNSRLTSATNKGILAGSVVAIRANGLIGAAAGDGANFDNVVGIAVNDAVGNPYESSSAVASQKVVYAHGSGTVFSTDIYEAVTEAGAGNPVTYANGDLMYASQNGLLTNASGCIGGAAGNQTVIGILLQKPTQTDPFMVVQMKI